MGAPDNTQFVQLCLIPRVQFGVQFKNPMCPFSWVQFMPRMGHGLGHPGVQEMGTSPKVAKRQRKTPLSGWKAVFLWLRGLDLNQRPPGYEPDELPTALPRDILFCGAGDRTRTGTVSLPGDFKSPVSTYSTTPADIGND